MKPTILNEVFAEFCESHFHFDSLLSKVDPAYKSRVATILGAFLRRPLTIAKHFGHDLGTPEEFWSLNFIKLKKHPEIHACFSDLWEKWESIPNEGGVIDFPPKLIEQMTKDWGEERVAKIAKFMSLDPLTTIRLHRRSFDKENELKPEVLEWLKTAKLPKSRTGNFSPRARIFKGYAAVQRNELFQQGYFEIQDEGSQFMSLYALFPEAFEEKLQPFPQVESLKKDTPKTLPDAGAITVIDACAGAGGKTLALADALQGRGRLYAYDIFERKVRSLRDRVARSGDNNVQATLLDEEGAVLAPFQKTADVVLVDAPCSGYGVLRRNPDTKWNRKPMELARRDAEIPLPELQEKLLTRYSGLVKPGGRLVFGVCTFLKEESVEITEKFVNSNPEFTLQSQGFVGPYDTDGFYMASLKRKK